MQYYNSFPAEGLNYLPSDIDEPTTLPLEYQRDNGIARENIDFLYIMNNFVIKGFISSDSTGFHEK